MSSLLFHALDGEVVADQQFETANIADCHMRTQLLVLADRESTCAQLVEQVLGVKLDDDS